MEIRGRDTRKTSKTQRNAGEGIEGRSSAQHPSALPAWAPPYRVAGTHLLTVIFSEFTQKPGSLLSSQVPQEGSQDRTDMLWGGKEKREHAVIRAVIITSLQAWPGSTRGGISRPP